MTNNQPYKPSNHRIISIRQKQRILHVEDALDIGKIRFELWHYTAGSGAHAHADAYLDADTARVLFHEFTHIRLDTLDNHRLQGGGTSNGSTVARFLTFTHDPETKNPFRVSIANGPGYRLANGLITPNNWEKNAAQVTRISMLLSHLDAKRLGLAGLHHLQAWAAATYHDRIHHTTFQPADTSAPGPPPDPSAPDPNTGELPTGDDPLLYANHQPVGDDPRERQAYLAYITAEKAIPESVDHLRRWVLNTPKAA